jgi:hypothetical protein
MSKIYLSQKLQQILDIILNDYYGMIFGTLSIKI